MSHLSTIIYIFLWVMSGFVNCKQSRGIPPLPTVENGVVDLRDWDFQTSEIALKGEWEIYWNEFRSNFENHPVNHSNNTSVKKYVTVPGQWSNTNLDPVGGGEGMNGTASYKISIFLSDSSRILGLSIPPMDTTFSLYWNGKEIARNGDVYPKMGSVYPVYYAPLVVSLEDAKPGENTIHLHMANSIYPRPGFRDALILGDFEKLSFRLNTKLYWDVFLTGTLFIIGIYHLGLWVLRRKDKSTLYFALLSLVIVLRIPIQGEAFAYQLIPITWKISTFLEYFTFYFAYGFLGFFIKSLYPRESIPSIDKFVFYSVGIFVAILIAFPLSVYTKTFLYFEILTIFLTTYYFYILILALKRKRESAIGFLISLFLFMLTYINDLLYVNRVIDSFYMTGLGLFLFFFAQAFLLSKRFSKAFNTAETLTEELDEKVRERTLALEREKEKSDSLLRNIQKDLKYSKKIQKSIVPKLVDGEDFKIGVFYKPMDEVGGDIYDMFRLHKDRNVYRVMLADAIGHGVQGALVTMAIKSEYENLKKFIRTPAELMEVLNVSIINTYKTMYFTCFIADIDLDKKTIQYCSAGHPEQTILRDTELLPLAKTGPMVGIKQNIDYHGKIVDLKEKDTLYFFSDGMFEVFNERQEEFGDERFGNLLLELKDEPPNKTIQRILETLQTYKGSSRFDDDMTLLVLDLN